LGFRPRRPQFHRVGLPAAANPRARPKDEAAGGHGLFDLATPYFTSKIQLDQLPAYASPDRVKLVVYPGGHMFYSRDASRQAFRDEIEKMMK
jgi:carboxypeptidase C (cathepsin A)